MHAADDQIQFICLHQAVMKNIFDALSFFNTAVILIKRKVYGLKKFIKSKRIDIQKIDHSDRKDTKLWHFSPLTLFNMYDEEKKTGNFVIPEET